jgi:WhiB family transcriptional regulator, redox-sensing transcriptional regulator
VTGLHWVADAVCVQIDPEMFHPKKGEDSNHGKAVKRVFCQRCPVKSECLEHALDDPGLSGIWGGMTENERRRMRRMRRSAA